MKGDSGYPVRLRFTKLGKVRFVSHRDVARAFERAFRIEQLPLAFTQGFSPRPKVSFGLALGVAHESQAEYLDVELAQPVEVDALPEALSRALPEGIDVTGAGLLADRAPSLQESVGTVEIDLRLGGVAREQLVTAVERALVASTMPVTTIRKGREVAEDLRPALRDLTVHETDEGPAVHVEALTQPRGLRPADLLLVLRELADATERQEPVEDRVLRTHQWIERDGARREPLDADRATRAIDALRVTDKGRTHDRREDSGGDGFRAEDAEARRIA